MSTDALVACRGESLAGNVASVASPSQEDVGNPSPGFPAVVRQKHMSVR